METNNSFSDAPMLPLMIKMAAPSIMAQLVNMFYSIVDRIYIGHIPDIGSKALAGIGVCNAVIIVVAAFAQFAGGGGAPLAAISLGSGKKNHAEAMLGNGALVLLVLALLLTVPLYLFMDPLLYAIGASGNTITYAHEYLSVYLLGTVFVMITIGLNPFVNAQGCPKTAMLSVVIGAAINIILDPVLIYGFNMGVRGAAIATVVSQAVSACWILRFLTSKSTFLRLRLSRLRPSIDILSAMLALGISPFIMASTESLIGLIMNRGLSRYGDVYVSALAIMQSTMQFSAVPVTGFSQGATPVLSFNYGNGDDGRLREGFRILFVVMTAWNFIVTLCIMLMPKVFAGIFTSDAMLIDTVGKVMPVFMAGMTIFGMQRACQTTFVALNQPRTAIFIALLRKIFLLIPLAMILPHWFGVMGIYGAEAVADIIAALSCMTIFFITFPRILAQNPNKKIVHV